MNGVTLGGLATVVIAWMTTSLVVGAGLAVIAAMAHHLARRALPARLIWAVSLATTLVVTLLLPARMTTTRGDLALPAASSVTSAVDGSPLIDNWSDRVVLLTSSALARTEHEVRALATRNADRVAVAPPAVQWMVVLAWPLTTIMLLGLFGLSYRRQSRALARASRLDVHGVAVRGRCEWTGGARTPRTAHRGAGMAHRARSR